MTADRGPLSARTAPPLRRATDHAHYPWQGSPRGPAHLLHPTAPHEEVGNRPPRSGARRTEHGARSTEHGALST